MNEILYLLPGLFGVVVGILVAAAPRFGRASGLLSLFLGLPALGFVLHPIASDRLPAEWAARLAFVALLPAIPAAVAFLWRLDRPRLPRHAWKRAACAAVFVAPAPVLAAWILMRPPALERAAELSVQFVALGPGGYCASLYLLTLSVAGLARIEQTLRTSGERALREIKFLLLGLAVSFASMLYIASKVLLYSFALALLPVGALHVYPLISLLAAALILISWRRTSSSREAVRVSHSLVYSSFTLLGVAVYLIVSGVLARWASQLGGSPVQVEAVVFLLSALAMGGILLWPAFRHRLRVWLRRNIFAGHYDYRQYWMEAAEKVRSVDPPEVTARALAEVTQSALGTIDVGVWIRERNPNRLTLAAFLGTEPETPERVVHGIVESLLECTEVTAAKELEPAADGLRTFIRQTHAALLVPLVSSDRVVGVLTVGPDRSGQHYQQETRDFLRVLGGHAAGELHKSELLATLMEAKETEAFRSFSTFLLHDLKNFASTLSMIAKNAVRHQDNPDFQKDAFASVHETAEKMKRLCNSLKTFSGNLAAHRKAEDLNEIVRTGVATTLNGCDQAVRLELAAPLPVFVDAEEMARVLQNLLLNAREATPSTGEIRVVTAAADGKAEMVVEDNGSGISAEFLENMLFHPFHTTKSDGLGIGLFQCRKIVEAHGGTISVESKSGVGTSVRVVLPCASESVSTASVGRSAP